MNETREETLFDFVGPIRLFGVLSGGLTLLSVIAIATFGLNYGIDFAGGHEIQVRFPPQQEVGESAIREALAPLNLSDLRVQRLGLAQENQYLIMGREQVALSEVQRQNLKEAFAGLAGGVEKLTEWVLADNGEHLRVGFAEPHGEEELRAVATRQGFTVKQVTRGEREDLAEYTVAFVSLADQIEKHLRESLKIAQETPIVQRVEFVGPQVGAQLRNQGILAVVYAMAFILLYVALRFDLFFAPGAIISILHDVLITLGIFSVFQLEFNLPVVAAILALVGYSLNDTIVVYDRIRENLARWRGRELRSLVNASINQTLSRTLLTSGTAMLVVIALLVFGGENIRDLSIALFIGIVVGTYSSVAIASPVYIFLRERYQKRVPGDRQQSGSAAKQVSAG